MKYICMYNYDYEASLTTGVTYEAIPDLVAEAEGFVRIIDDSGEDYLYPEEMFCPTPLHSIFDVK